MRRVTVQILGSNNVSIGVTCRCGTVVGNRGQDRVAGNMLRCRECGCRFKLEPHGAHTDVVDLGPPHAPDARDNFYWLRLTLPGGPPLPWNGVSQTRWLEVRALVGKTEERSPFVSELGIEGSITRTPEPPPM